MSNFTAIHRARGKLSTRASSLFLYFFLHLLYSSCQKPEKHHITSYLRFTRSFSITFIIARILCLTMSFQPADYNAIQNAIGYTFSHNNLLLEALDTTGLWTAESNQRLAMLGDALLKLILLEDWYASSNAKGTCTTCSWMIRVIADDVQDKATTWSPPLVAMPIWPSLQEMLDLTIILSSTLDIAETCRRKRWQQP